LPANLIQAKRDCYRSASPREEPLTVNAFANTFSSISDRS
jgi:hypothetical protein